MVQVSDHDTAIAGKKSDGTFSAYAAVRKRTPLPFCSFLLCIAPDG